MRLCYAIPTANPTLCGECFAAWRSMGWDTFAIVEGDANIPNATEVVRQDEYPGWGESFNRLARHVAGRYDWLATGGDDCFPDRHTALNIGLELSERFAGTMGVAQAAGDGWAWDKWGTVSPICFAPFIGAEFAARWNSGRGAFFPDYFQWFADNELRDTAEAAGLLWVNRLWHVEHRHVAKDGRPTPPYKLDKQPRWADDCSLYRTRAGAGFPGHAPLP